MDKYKTGELIRTARTNKGYTQTELGDLIGVTNKAVSRWEKGESFPDVGLLEDIARVLDLKIEQLVTGDDVSGGENGADAVVGDTEGSGAGQADISDSETREEIMVDMVRTVKMQQKEKSRMIRRVLLPVLAYGLMILHGFILLSDQHAQYRMSRIDSIIMICVYVLIIVSVVRQKESFIKPFDRMSAVLCGAEAFCAIYSIAITVWCISSIEEGRIPFGLELHQVGPVLAWQLIACAMFSVGIAAITMFRYIRREVPLTIESIICVMSFYIATVYRLLLGRCDTLDGFRTILYKETVVIIAAFVIAIVFTCVVRRVMRKDMA